MRIWIESADGRVKEYDVDDLPDALNMALAEKAKDWDFFSFRNPPRTPEPKQEPKYF